MQWQRSLRAPRAHFVSLLAAVVVFSALGASAAQASHASHAPGVHSRTAQHAHAGAQHSRHARSDRGGVTIRIGHHGPRTHGPGYESPATRDYRFGHEHGYTAGHEQGYLDGLYGRRYNCVCTISLRRYSIHYQRGFHAGFDSGYDVGYCAGTRLRAARRVQICW